MTGNAPEFKMERVRGDLPPDANPPKRGRGRQPLYAAKLQEIVKWFRTPPQGKKRDPWWLIAQHENRKGSEAVLARIKRGEIEVPRGTTWEFETRQDDSGHGLLYGRIVDVSGQVVDG